MYYGNVKCVSQLVIDQSTQDFLSAEYTQVFFLSKDYFLHIPSQEQQDTTNTGRGRIWAEPWIHLSYLQISTTEEAQGASIVNYSESQYVATKAGVTCDRGYLGLKSVS